MSGRVDTASRMIRAPSAVIYRALSTPEAVESWMPPQGMTGRMLAFDFREGGVYRLRLTCDEPPPGRGKTSDDADEVEVRFVKLIPNQCLEQAVIFNSDDPEYAGEMRMKWTLEPTPDGTLVTVRCEDVPPGIHPADHQAGFESTLANLAACTEQGR